MHKDREETIEVYVKERRTCTGQGEQVVCWPLQEDLSKEKFNDGGSYVTEKN